VRIDLVVIDLDSEPGLVDEIRSSQPELRLLYVSDRTDEQPEDSEHHPLLLTPFSLDELRVAIAGLLERSESEATDGGGTGP
jgi:DNA-binding response OmpR family regulator